MSGCKAAHRAVFRAFLLRSLHWGTGFTKCLSCPAKGAWTFSSVQSKSPKIMPYVWVSLGHVTSLITQKVAGSDLALAKTRQNWRCSQRVRRGIRDKSNKCNTAVFDSHFLFPKLFIVWRVSEAYSGDSWKVQFPARPSVSCLVLFS